MQSVDDNCSSLCKNNTIKNIFISKVWDGAGAVEGKVIAKTFHVSHSTILTRPGVVLCIAFL